MGIQERVTSYSQRYIDKKTKHYLKETTLIRDVFTSYLKYTKNGNPERPIISSKSHPTERILQFVVNVIPKLSARLELFYTQKSILKTYILKCIWKMTKAYIIWLHPVRQLELMKHLSLGGWRPIWLT